MSLADQRYVELQVTSHFSFLRGASSPEELLTAAAKPNKNRMSPPKTQGDASTTRAAVEPPAVTSPPLAAIASPRPKRRRDPIVLAGARC